MQLSEQLSKQVSNSSAAFELKDMALKQIGKTHTRNDKGFTLIEIMIVLVILGGLMAILGTSVIDKLNKSRQKEAYIQIKSLSNELNQYNLDCQTFPSSEQGLQALAQSPGAEGCPNWGPEPYIKQVPKDPWGHAYIYESDGGKFTITSYGKDGKPGGTGYDRDISSEDNQ